MLDAHAHREALGLEPRSGALSPSRRRRARCVRSPSTTASQATRSTRSASRSRASTAATCGPAGNTRRLDRVDAGPEAHGAGGAPDRLPHRLDDARQAVRARCAAASSRGSPAAHRAPPASPARRAPHGWMRYGCRACRRSTCRRRPRRSSSSTRDRWAAPRFAAARARRRVWTSRPRSNTVTRRPAARQSSAQNSPAGPLPTIATCGAVDAGAAKVGGVVSGPGGTGSPTPQTSTTSRHRRARGRASNDSRRSRASASAPGAQPSVRATAARSAGLVVAGGSGDGGSRSTTSRGTARLCPARRPRASDDALH